MKKLDFILSSSLVLVAILLGLSLNNEAIFFVLFIQFFTGIYQLIVMLIRTIAKNYYSSKTQRQFLYYWLACIAFVFIGFILSLFDPSKEIVWLYLLSAWAIAIYYCTISYHIAYPAITKSHLDI